MCHCNVCAFENLYEAFLVVFLFSDLTLGRLVAENLTTHIKFFEFCKNNLKIILQRFRHLRTIFGRNLVFVGARSVGLSLFREKPF